MIDLAHVFKVLGIDHVTPELREVLLPFLAKAEKDRRHLLIRKDFTSLLNDGVRYARELAATGVVS